MATHKIYLENNNEEIKVLVGDVIIIELPENPTTGYQWESVNLNTDILAEKQSFFIPSDAGIGAGGMKKIEFEVKSTGQGTIILRNIQKWSHDIFQDFMLKLSV